LDPDDKANAPLLPGTVDQLGWLGLSPTSIEVLRPYVTVLPERTPVNLNTASAWVLHACIGTLSMADAQRLEGLRTASHFRTLADVAQALGTPNLALNDAQHSVNSRYFEVQGQLRLDALVLEDRSVMQRNGLVVKLLRHEKGALPTKAFTQ
jgi:general secretion pathway protein K